MYCKSLEVLDIFCYVGLLISCVCMYFTLWLSCHLFKKIAFLAFHLKWLVRVKHLLFLKPTFQKQI